MRKLLLTSLTWMTGDLHCEEQRLVVVDSKGDDEADFHQAIARAKQWFPENHPNSKLLSIVPNPTIDIDPSEDDRIEMYSRDALVSFGKYLLSIERTKRIINNFLGSGRGIPSEDHLKEVYHADVENWKAGQYKNGSPVFDVDTFAGNFKTGPREELKNISRKEAIRTLKDVGINNIEDLSTSEIRDKLIKFYEKFEREEERN